MKFSDFYHFMEASSLDPPNRVNNSSILVLLRPIPSVCFIFFVQPRRIFPQNSEEHVDWFLRSYNLNPDDVVAVIPVEGFPGREFNILFHFFAKDSLFQVLFESEICF